MDGAVQLIVQLINIVPGPAWAQRRPHVRLCVGTRVHVQPVDSVDRFKKAGSAKKNSCKYIYIYWNIAAPSGGRGVELAAT